MLRRAASHTYRRGFIIPAETFGAESFALERWAHTRRPLLLLSLASELCSVAAVALALTFTFGCLLLLSNYYHYYFYFSNAADFNHTSRMQPLKEKRPSQQLSFSTHCCHSSGRPMFNYMFDPSGFHRSCCRRSRAQAGEDRALDRIDLLLLLLLPP